MIYREGDDRYELLREDEFLQDDTYEEYSGPDLSNDPMTAPHHDDKRKKETRREKKVRQELERLDAEREAIKADLLAKIKSGEIEVDADSAEKEPENEERPRRNSFGKNLMSVLSGNILSRSEATKVYLYLLFVVCLAFFYIWNIFDMHSLHRRQQSLTIQVKELRAKSIMTAAEKMELTRQSNIINEIERRGLPLKESLTPNKVIRK